VSVPLQFTKLNQVNFNLIHDPAPSLVKV